MAAHSSHFETFSFYYLPDLSSGCLFFLFLLALSVLSYFVFLSVHVRACTLSTARPEIPASSGCHRVLMGRGGVARSAVAAFVPWCRVCLDKRGMHARALSGLNL